MTKVYLIAAHEGSLWRYTGEHPIAEAMDPKILARALTGRTVALRIADPYTDYCSQIMIVGNYQIADNKLNSITAYTPTFKSHYAAWREPVGSRLTVVPNIVAPLEQIAECEFYTIHRLLALEE